MDPDVLSFMGVMGTIAGFILVEPAEHTDTMR